MASKTDIEAEAFARGVHASRKFTDAVSLRQWEREASKKGVSYPGGGALDLYDATYEILQELSKSYLVQNRRPSSKFIRES